MWEGRRDEVVESLKNDYVELIEKLDYDIITVELVPPKGFKHPDPPKKRADNVWEDSKGNIYKYAASNDSIICITRPEGKEELSEKDIENAYGQAAGLDESIFELVDFIAGRYGNERAILFRDIDIYWGLMGPFGGDYNHQLVISKIAPEEIKKGGAAMSDPALAFVWGASLSGQGRASSLPVWPGTRRWARPGQTGAGP
jgi:hypothetical protein